MKKMQAKTLKLFAFMLGTAVLIGGCKKDEETEQENITKIIVHLTAAGFDKEFEWADRDGAGGNAPVIDTIVVPANTQFDAHLHVYDESKSPVVDLSEEIEGESTAHLFVYKSSVTGLSVSDLDKDSNGNPFGIESVWSTGAAGTGSVRITLHHEPTDKNAAEPGGEVDFDVTFPVKVQ